MYRSLTNNDRKWKNLSNVSDVKNKQYKKLNLSGEYKKILIIPDLHFPYEHPDAIRFLDAIKKDFNGFDLIINLGDIVDQYQWSQYEANPEAMNQIEELKLASNKLNKLIKLFPKMVITLGNHDIRLEKKLIKNGISPSVLQRFETLYSLNDNEWIYADELGLWWNDEARRVLFIHEAKSDILKTCDEFESSVVSGHRHSSLEIKFSLKPSGIRFGLQSGCLVDKDRLAFNYRKPINKRFILGASVIINGIASIIPMKMKANGMWDNSQFA